MMMMYRVIGSLFFASAAGFADMAWVMAEGNLEKRSERALKNANDALDRAVAAYKQGDRDEDAAALTEVRESIELCKKSLDDSGKDPRRNSKYFKKAEIELRKLIRERGRLDTFRFERSVDDREPIDRILEIGTRIHEDLVLGIMGKKR